MTKAIHSLRRASLALALLLLALLFSTAPASADTTCSKYASPTGSDSAAGTAAAPYRTAQHLADSLSAGQTGCLREGSYTASGPYVLSPGHGGAPSAPIAIRSYPGEHARLVGIVNVAHGVDNVTLSNLTFEGTGGSNSVKIYSSGVTVESSEITNAWRGLSCMMLGNNSGGGQAVKPVIRGNVFHACGSLANGNKDHGIYASNVLEGEIVDNVLYDNAAYAIQLYPNAQHTVFAHNVVDGSSPSVRGGLVLGSEGPFASSNNTVAHNVIAYAQTYDIVSSWEGPMGSGNVASENCLWSGKLGTLSNGGGLTASANVTANPEFQNRSAHDYTLPANSPCLAKVGYDTAAKLAGKEPAPEAGPEPAQPEGSGPESPSPQPEVSETESPPLPQSEPAPAPSPETAPAPAPTTETTSSGKNRHRWRKSTKLRARASISSRRSGRGKSAHQRTHRRHPNWHRHSGR